ncbi:DarT ssDNA thymidine ADP-ribosyltransferase family protein [Rhodanobacter sp. B05]|uniref:DarT ssDNA thymidine ADP-ribosyltransferase family protein n=1 Tax=Rhodanobacter sp. B05 TaxID=1945859 RepID=UPI00143BE3EA|nr:DarT ssDNA thymidine ADP-ribosyltransferase family protein [Rhodanobacter sp. B05]
MGIGNADLIGRRRDHPLPPPCPGTLGDYVPFYFTPYSPMLNNIRTGWGGVARRDRSEITFLVSSLPRLNELGIDFVFSDRHAYLAAARFSNVLVELAASLAT